jgi:membrane protein YdbS with pleckstrin-like domain
MRIIVPVVAGKIMGLYGLFLLLTSMTVYDVYPGYEQAYAGVVLFVTMVVLDLTIVPIWLYKYFTKNDAPSYGLG